MTNGALISELPAMHVVTSMAAGAVRRKLYRRDVGHRLAVATVAVKTIMCAV